MVDDSKDISLNEQLRFVIRFMSAHGEAWEQIYQRFSFEKFDAELLANTINDGMMNNKLSWDACAAQCQGETSVMSGWLSGVQARVKAVVALHAIYVHCLAHRLNLID